MSYRIRMALASDSPAATRVVRRVYEEYGFIWDSAGYHADLLDLDAHYLRVGFPFWVAERKDGAPLIVGTAALDLFETVPGVPGALVLLDGTRRVSGADCSLERLYVDPDARRLGIGSALFRLTLEEARRRGRHRMEIWSDKRFVDAHRLYERLGARILGDRICDDPDRSPEWGMALNLGDELPSEPGIQISNPGYPRIESSGEILTFGFVMTVRR